MSEKPRNNILSNFSELFHEMPHSERTFNGTNIYNDSNEINSLGKSIFNFYQI